jgi:putative DNA primase/helicase
MAIHAAAACFRSWLAGRGGEGAAEDRQAIDVLKLFIALHGNSRFERLNDVPDMAPLEQKIVARAGYARPVGDGREFLVLAPVWREEVFRGMDARRAAKAIFNAGFLAQLIQGGAAVWLPELRAQSSVAPFTSRHRAWIVNGAGVGGIG